MSSKIKISLKGIIIGWARKLKLISTPDSIKTLSDLRLRICKNCDKSKKSKIVRILNGNAKYEHQLQCTECSCPCLEKTLVVSESCPINNW